MGKQKEPGQSFREINPRLGGMLGLSKLGPLLPASREKTAAQPPAPVCLSREWGAGAACQAVGVGGHASPLWLGPVSVSRRDTVWTERTCLSVNTAAFVSRRPVGSLLPEALRSQGSQHPQDELQAAAGQDSGVVPFSGLANKSKSTLVQRIFLVVYSKC